MNIKQLSKSIQDYVVDGCTYIAIYKNGRSWDYSILDCDSEEQLQNDKELKEFVAIDSNVIVVNGYYDNFGTNSIADIEYRVKHNYETGISNIFFENDTKEEYKCEVCGKFISKDEGITTLNGLWVCDNDTCRTLDKENQATEKTEVEQALDDFVRYCDGEIPDNEYLADNSPKVVKTEFEVFHDVTYYSDGTKSEYYIGD